MNFQIYSMSIEEIRKNIKKIEKFIKKILGECENFEIGFPGIFPKNMLIDFYIIFIDM